MEETFSDEIKETPTPKKRQSKGFSVVEKVDEPEVETSDDQPEVVEEAPVTSSLDEARPVPRYSTPLTRPLPRKTSVPRRGFREATQIRP